MMMLQIYHKLLTWSGNLEWKKSLTIFQLRKDCGSINQNWQNLLHLSYYLSQAFDNFI